MVEVIPMNQGHLSAAFEIGCRSFSVPWSYEALADDLIKPESIYFVAALNGDTIGYAGMWHIINEGHITNIAVLPEHRRVGAGTLLLNKLLETAAKLEMNCILLEVRSGNYDAQRLYMKNGFTLERIRKNYYSDTGEDAYVLCNTLGFSCL